MLFANPKRAPNLDALLPEDSVYLLPVEPEDMWHANNLIAVDDLLRGHAIRKVSRESTTGSTSTERVHTELSIRVTKTFFDPAASRLHVSGKVEGENSVVSMGQHHTLDLELNRPFRLWKRHGWDSVAVAELKNALSQDRDGSAIAAVVMEATSANICLITDFRTVLKQRVEGTSATKMASNNRRGDSKPSSAFFEKVLATLLRNVDFSTPRALLLASPGYTAAEFRKYMSEEGARKADKALIKIAREAVVTHSSSGQVFALQEVLGNKEVMPLLRDRKFASETRHMDVLLERIRMGDGRATYGVSTVEKAVAETAVGRGGGVLLINNDLFRSQDIRTRKRFVAIVDKVKGDGGDARILSADHESGERLSSLGGIAALLTYPIYDLEEAGDGNENADEEPDSII